MEIEKVMEKDSVLAIIIYSHAVTEGIRFFTPDHYSLQVGKHNHPKGKIINPHRHMPVKIARTGSLQETLYIEEGKVKIIFYNSEGMRLEEKILGAGDMILLMEGGHGFEFLEPTKMIEIKQGPYVPESKKSLNIEGKK